MDLKSKDPQMFYLIIIGCVVVLILISIGVCCLLRECRRKRNKRSATALLENLNESKYETDDESFISDDEDRDKDID